MIWFWAVAIAALMAAFLVVGLRPIDAQSPPSERQGDLPIVERAFRDCLLANGYGSVVAGDMDQLDRNSQALDRCDYLLP